jgi:hypothetical protein
MVRRVTGYGVGAAKIELAPVPAKNNGVPTSTTAFDFGQLVYNEVTQTWYIYSGGTNYIALGGGSSQVSTINSLSPVGGNIIIAGTSNQLSVGSAGHTVTLSLPSAITAPGSLTATTTLTATLGAITATNGNFVGTAVGTGILLNSAQNSGAASGAVTVNGRSGRATFTSVSIAAAADLTLTITNSSITASTTEVLVSMSGATTGAGLCIKSKTASAGSLAIVVTNATGATTSTADIEIDFLVLNA